MMMKKFISASLLLGICALGATSCSKGFEVGDELYPQPKVETGGQIAYMITATADNSVTLTGLEAQLILPSNLTTVGEAIPFAVNLTQPASATTSIGLSLVPATEVFAAYTALGGDTSGFVAAPDGLLALASSTLSVEAGAKKAEASLVWGNKDLLTTMEDSKLLAAVKIANTSSGRVSTKYNTLFFEVSKTTLKIKPLLEADWTGKTPIANDAFTAAPTHWTDYGPRYAFDGLLNTNNWLVETARADALEITLNEVTDLAGLRIAPPSGGFSSYRIRTLRIELLDENGVVLHNLGPYALNSSVYKDNYYNFEFYSPLKCKQIRLVPVNHTRPYYGVSEIGLFR